MNLHSFLVPGMRQRSSVASARFCGVMLVLSISIGIVGCGDDDPGVPQVGTVTINAEPNSVAPPWQITGPSGFEQSGDGDEVLEDMRPGDYTLAWGAVVDWETPSPATVTQTLTVYGTVAFAGTYVAQRRTITIDPEPNRANAPWQIAGPDGFSQTGIGDTTLDEVAAGSYTLTWGELPDWTTPDPATVTQMLSANGSVTFTVTYSPHPGTITIDVVPDDANGPWQISGPEGFSLSGHEDTTLENMASGSYTVTWGAVMGWTPPSPETRTLWLAANGAITFTGSYDNSGTPTGFAAVSVITGNYFYMGSPASEPERERDEVRHDVNLLHGFYMQATEVTNQQYRDLAQWAYDHGYCTATSTSLFDNLDGSVRELLALGSPACDIAFDGETFTVNDGKQDYPVHEVTWYGSAAYCDWLSLQRSLPRAYDHGTWRCNDHDPYNAQGFRLPTEAEWEYACRAGCWSAFTDGPLIDTGCDPVDQNLDAVGWYCGNAGDWSHPVAQKQANAWGLYDLHGNLWEWCNDWYGSYGDDIYVTDPAGPATGTVRVIRGGSWVNYAQGCRSAKRSVDTPSSSGRYGGFRPVRTSD